jgi:hypothetical protein
MESNQEQNQQLGRLTAKGNYDPRFIKQVINEIQEGLPVKAALTRYGLKKDTLRYWLYGSAKYHFKRTKAPATPVATKRAIACAVREDRMTLKEAMAACKIQAAKTIREWIAWEKAENDELTASNQQEMAKKSIAKKDAAPQPSQEEIASLRQALAEEKLKTAALNTLIDVAEEQLKINIRKKPGARQS